MSWHTIHHHPGLATAGEAAQLIRSGDRLFLSGNVSVPRMVLDALVRRAPELRDVEICQSLTVGPADYVAPEMQGHLRVNSMFISANVRQALYAGRVDFTP